MKRIACISDLQTPFEDRKAVRAVAQFLEWWQPDLTCSVGDEFDLPQISRYSKGNRGEFEGDLGKDRDHGKDVLRMLGIQHITRSNHLDRWFDALSRVPAFQNVPEFQLENFLGLDDLGITYHPTPWAPTGTGTWLLMHGDEGAMSPNAGSTSQSLSLRAGKNVIAGHTHRLGLVPKTQTFLGDPKPRVWFGFEAGCLADFDSPGMKYAKFKNWQQGFGLLYVDGKTVHPVPVPIVNRSFVVDGKRFTF